MPNFLVPAVLGNLCAVFAHLFSWRLREKHFQWLAVIGCLGFLVGTAMIGCHCRAIHSRYEQSLSSVTCGTAYYELLKVRDAEVGKVWQTVWEGFFITLIFALIEQFYVSAVWWRKVRDLSNVERITLPAAHWIKALLVVWGELFIGMAALLACYKILAPPTPHYLYGAFAISWLSLTFLRPLLWRWAKPVFQIGRDMLDMSSYNAKLKNE